MVRIRFWSEGNGIGVRSIASCTMRLEVRDASVKLWYDRNHFTGSDSTQGYPWVIEGDLGLRRQSVGQGISLERVAINCCNSCRGYGEWAQYTSKHFCFLQGGNITTLKWLNRLLALGTLREQICT